MKTMKLTPIRIITLLYLLYTAIAAAEDVSLESKEGKVMVVSLISRQGDKVLIKRKSDNKKFTISPDSLSEKSKKIILEKMKTLKVDYPKLEALVIINKRRKGDDVSLFTKELKRSTITSKITLKKIDSHIPCPTCTMNIVFLGESQRLPDNYMILSNQAFQVTPTDKGIITKTTPFSTSYDKDKEGVGNIGGYKYVGYLLIITNAEKEIIYTKTNSSVFKKALKLDASAAERAKSFTQNTLCDHNIRKTQFEKSLLGL